jgi:DNA-binding NtrC family response regulator
MTVLDAIYQTRPDVPVIMMSGHADDGVAQDSRKRGAFDFLVKPFSIDAFVRIIAAALA